MRDRDCGDRGVGYGQRHAFASVIAFQESSQARDRPGNVVVVEALQELLGRFLLSGAHPGVDLRHVDRTTGEQAALVKEIEQKLSPSPLPVQGINDDAGV